MTKRDQLQIKRQKLYATAKTHKFNSIEDFIVEELKFRSIVGQTGSFTYNFSKVF